MKNKYIKLFIIAIITMFISVVPTYAKEVTLENKGNERDTFEFIINRENPDAAYVYLIGKYAFTSAHEMGLQDMMLAARSIQLTEGKLKDKEIPEKLDNMTIYLFKHASGSTEWQPQIVVGKTPLPVQFNVKYIDYHYVKKDKKVDTDKIVKEAMNNVSKDMFTVKEEEIAKNEVTIDIKTGKLTEKIAKGMNSGVFTALTNLVENAKVKSITFEYKNVEPLTLDGSNLDSSKMVEWLNNNSQTIFEKNVSDLILADLLDREFKATVNLGESEKNSYVSKKHATPNETYTIKFTGTRQEVSTTEKAKTALDKLSSSSEIFEFTEHTINGKVTINIKTDKLNTIIEEGMASGVLPLLESLVNDKDVESIDFAYKTKNGEEINYTLKKGFNKADLLKWFEDNCEKILGYPANEAQVVDLINKSFTATINLKNYAQKTKTDPENYTITFDGTLPEVDPQALVKELKEGNTINKSFFEMDGDRSQNQNITMKVKDINRAIEQGMNSGIFAALQKVANKEGVQSVDFKYNNLLYSFTKTTNIADLAKWFDEHKKDIFGEKDQITLADLHNKEFFVTINVGRIGKLKDNAENTYKITMLMTHDVTFHDEKAKESKKEVVTVYDGEAIPEDEVKKRSTRSTDKETDVFLGWYEEIEEGNDKEDKFDFETRITEDMELDAHWGTKLTTKEKQAVTDATNAALSTINSHQDTNLYIKVNGQNISIINNNPQGSNVTLLEILSGSGAKTALSNMLDTAKTNIYSITLSLGNESEYSKEITKVIVDNAFSFANELDELFKKKIGISVYYATWGDILQYVSDLKVKVNYKDGKILDNDNNSEYSFELNNKVS